MVFLSAFYGGIPVLSDFLTLVCYMVLEPTYGRFLGLNQQTPKDVHHVFQCFLFLDGETPLCTVYD